MKNGVKNIQSVGYNGACTVHGFMDFTMEVWAGVCDGLQGFGKGWVEWV